MGDLDLCYASATELARRIRSREVSPVEVVEAVLSRIEAVNPPLNAWTVVLGDRAREAARRAESAVMRREPLGPLHGIPVSIKDLIFTRGIRTTFGSELHADFVPDRDAPGVARLLAAGAIIVGKTTTPEFGWKAVTDSRLFGITRNCWNRELTPSGSSGGAAVAVATGMGPIALGSDGGGSIRTPAACCGIVGLKPSFGRVAIDPLLGWEALDYRLEHHGPLTRTVADATLMLDVIAGPSASDPTSLPEEGTSFSEALHGEIRGLHVAWSPGFNGAVVDPTVRAVVEPAARAFATDLGCVVDDVAPDLAPLHQAYQILFAADVAAALGDRLPEAASRLDRGLVRVIEIGQTVTAVQYSRLRAEVYRAAALLGSFFERYDLMLTPTFPVPSFRVGLDWPREIAGQKVHPLGILAFTYPFDLTGQPAISVPAGFTPDGLPVGLQIVGRRFADATVLRAAAALESARPWAARRPPV